MLEKKSSSSGQRRRRSASAAVNFGRQRRSARLSTSVSSEGRRRGRLRRLAAEVKVGVGGWHVCQRWSVAKVGVEVGSGGRGRRQRSATSGNIGRQRRSLSMSATEVGNVGQQQRSPSKSATEVDIRGRW